MGATSQFSGRWSCQFLNVKSADSTQVGGGWRLKAIFSDQLQAITIKNYSFQIIDVKRVDGKNQAGIYSRLSEREGNSQAKIISKFKILRKIQCQSIGKSAQKSFEKSACLRSGIKELSNNGWDQECINSG